MQEGKSLNIAFKQRIVGAIFILSLGVILIPVILDTPEKDLAHEYSAKPANPGMPEIAEVAQINYVFTDIDETLQAEPAVQATTVAFEEPKVAAPAIIKKAEAPAPELKQALKPAPKSEPGPIDKAIARIDPVGDWTIQLGAFSNRDNANQLLNKLATEGFQAYLKEVPGRSMVKVFVAPGVERDKAQKLLTQLDDEYGIKGIIVRFRD